MNTSVTDMLEVYFIAGTQDTDDLPVVLEQALEAGITCFQFREKGEGSLEGQPLKLEEMARRCQALCRRFAVPFIINDNVELAMKLQADGVHVGQDDLSILEVRKKVGPQMIVGLSTNTLEQYEKALTATGVDYVGIGPAFQPRSKKDHEKVMGLDTIKEAMNKGKAIPSVAIGGINETNAASVWETGVDGLAVVSAVSQSENIKESVSYLKKASDFHK